MDQVRIFGSIMDPAALFPGKSASVFVGKEARWAPQQSERGDERKNFLRR